MNFLKVSCFALVLTTFIVLSGCYKKDLEEFKSIDSIAYAPTLALPFIQTSITLKDSLPSVDTLPSFTMTDTSSVQFPATNSSDTLTSVITEIDFKVYMENTFPIYNGDIQVYFADANNVFIDSLLSNSQRTIPAGNPSTIKDITAKVTKQRYLKIRSKCQRMYVFYRFNTLPSNINTYTNAYLKINMGIEVFLYKKI